MQKKPFFEDPGCCPEILDYTLICDTYLTTSILSWIKFYKILIKVRPFFRLLPYSAILLMANQGGDGTCKGFIKKTTHVAWDKNKPKQKTWTLHNKSCSYCWDNTYGRPLTSIILIKKLFRVLATVKSSIVNAVFPIWPIVKLPILCFPKT